MAELQKKSERRRYEALRKKYTVTPDFTNMSLIEELNVRNDLDDLEQLKQKFGVPSGSMFKKPECYMEFDGQNLSLYDDGIRFGKLDAQSGRDDYQSAQYQNVKNKGPLPEGTYYANQDQRQNLTFKNLALKFGEKLGFNNDQERTWSGSPAAWGIRRVWLQPDASTNTYGRDNFSIHGGLSKGSAGCIDIPWQTKELSNYMDGCQDSVPVYVKYPKYW